MSLGDGVHDSDVALKSLRVHEVGEHLPHLLGLLFGGSFHGRREDLVDGARPPGSDELVLVGEQELVAGGTGEDASLLAEDRCLEDFGGVLGHAVEDEFLGVAFPSRGQELVALSDHRVAHLPRREVVAGELRSVPVEEKEEGESDEGNKAQEEGQIEVKLHDLSFLP